jgi:hypothetical protein
MPYRIALRQPANLPFWDRMHALIPVDCSPGPFRRSESEACRDAFLDETVVLLNDVVQVRLCSAATMPAQFAGLFQFGDVAGIRWVPIHVDDVTCPR